MSTEKKHNRRAFLKAIQVKADSPVFLVVPLILLLLGGFIQSDYFVPSYEARHIRNTQRIIHHKEVRLQYFMERMGSAPTDLLPSLTQVEKKRTKKTGFCALRVPERYSCLMDRQ